MLKVLHLIHALNTGGAETLVKEYALHLDKTKFELVILCFYRCGSPYERLLEKAGIRVEYVCDHMKFWGQRGIIKRVFNHLQLRYLVRQLIRKEAPAIIHYHLPISSFVRLAKPKRGTRLYYTQHFSVDRWTKENPKDIRDLHWLIRHYQTQLIALNSQMANEMNELFAVNNTTVLNNGIDMGRYIAGMDRKAKRREIGIPEDGFVIVHVGRFTAIKNHPFLVQVFQVIHKKRENAFLLMVGSGPDESKIVNKLEEAGITTNNYKILHNRTDVPEILMACDGAIFPSFSEGLGIAVIEMQAAGLPCVASTNVPYATKISEGICYLELSDGAEKWANELLALVNKQNSLIPSAIKDWDISIVVKQLERLYEEGAK